jgi:hypothetical protein
VEVLRPVIAENPPEIFSFIMGANISLFFKIHASFLPIDFSVAAPPPIEPNTARGTRAV